MATSPNFGWLEPDNTDLVKNGALAIRTAVNAIDASLAELKGGTTGQVLSKTSATDMDFTWVAQDDSNAIQNAIVDAKGDLIAATAADTPARLAVGANGEMLVADSSTGTGLDWKTATEQYPWQTWTPTYTNLTIGNGTVTARYQQIGKLINFRFIFTLGSTSAVGTTPTISMPATPNNYYALYTTYIADNGVASYTGMSDSFAGVFYPLAQLTNATYLSWNYFSASVPFTWGNGDSFGISGSYEAA
jgi:hypothetical protein